LKQFILKIIILCALPIFFMGEVRAANTYDWTGNTSTNWAAASNWKKNNGTSTTYPGQSGNTDIVRIGVVTTIPTFYTYPVLANNITIASLTFGNDNSPVASFGGEMQLTVNATLTITGTLLQMHSATGGPANSGGTGSTVDDSDFEKFTFDEITTLLGTGTINCATFQVGDNTTGVNNSTVNATLVDIGNDYTTSTLTINVSGDCVLNSASKNNGTVVTRSSRSLISLQAGTLNITGKLNLTNNNVFKFVLQQYESLCLFSMDLYANANSPVLNLKGATPVLVGTSQYAANPVDFYNVNATGGTGTATVNYLGTNQRIYTYNGSLDPNEWIDVVPNDIYQNLTLSNSGTKTVDAGLLSVANNFTVSGTATVNMTSNNPTVIIGNDPAASGGGYYTIGGTTVNLGTGTVNITGSTFSNLGTTSIGTGLITFDSPSPTTLTTTAALAFSKVAFSGGGTKTLSSGSFSVLNTGVLTMSGATTLQAGGHLTLNSNSTSSATVAAIPSDCAINGNVSVQRYVTGGIGYRGYRLLSSPVNTGTNDANGNKQFSFNYITNSTYTTGLNGVAGGFTQGGNPTIYLWRENLIPSNASFTSGNFRGVGDLSASPNYLVIGDGTFNMPVGNGFLMFFRGGIGTPNPFQTTSTPLAATFTTTGILNQGSISVKDWYTPASPSLGFTTISGTIAVEGFNLVGNPYASSIDWSTYSTTNAAAGVYAAGGNVGPFAYILHTTGQGNGNYGTYDAVHNVIQNGGSKTIPSGMGFFVIASSNTASTLVFNEAAKTNTQVSPLNLYMGKPVATNTLSLLRLQLTQDTMSTDETLVLFDDNAKAGYDYKEDALYKTGTGKVSLSSTSSDQIALAINDLPLSLKGQIIPLKLSATIDGTYTLKMTEMKGIPQLYDVWLVDAFKKDSVNMRTTSTYSFTIAKGDTNTFGSTRFKLALRQNPAEMYKLLSFTADKVDNKAQVEVTWKVANEQNYTHFTLERSNNNSKTFEVIGGLTSSGQYNYSLLDKNPENGINLYRLKQEDFNSKISYSDVVEVQYADKSNNLTGSGHLSVYPNPAVNTINLIIDPKKQVTTYSIRVTNSAGTIVKQATTTQPNWQDNVSRLLTGTYLIQVVNGKDNSLVGQTKFIKL